MDSVFYTALDLQKEKGVQVLHPCNPLYNNTL